MDRVFKENPELKVCYKTSDGECFYTENDAKNYAKSLKDKKVQTVNRGVTSESETGTDENVDSTPKMNHREAIQAIQAAESLEELEQFKDYHQKTVIEALEKKTAKLIALIDVDTDAGADEDKNQNQE